MNDDDLIRRRDVRESLRSVDAWNMANAKPLEDGWEELMANTIKRFEVAAAVNASAVWNAEGSRAMAKLLKELTRHVDAAKRILAAHEPAEAGGVEAHDEQLGVWADELMADLVLNGLMDLVNHEYDVKVGARRTIIDALKKQLREAQSALRAARENALREALVALRGAGSFGRTAVEKHAALEQYCLCRDAILALIPKDGEKP